LALNVTFPMFVRILLYNLKNFVLMETTIKITNENLHHEKVNNVELDFTTCENGSFRGNVTIEEENGQTRTISGQHGSHDYEEEYGFVIE